MTSRSTGSRSISARCFRRPAVCRWLSALPRDSAIVCWSYSAGGLADRSVIAVVQSGSDAAPYIGNVFKAVFEEERNGADEGMLGDLLRSSGHDAPAILAAARAAETEAAYKANIAEALAAGVFGSPTYIREGELFWGQDRIELLEDALRSGRKPFSPDA